MAHAIERELIKVTNYKARNKFDDRQDYLSSILNAVMKLSDDDFDNLSDNAATWANSAVEAHNSKQDIPDFDEVEAAEDDAPDDDDAEEADDDADEEAEDQDEDDGDDDGADDDHDDSSTDPADDDDDDGSDEDEPEKAPKPAKAKAAKSPKKAAAAPKAKPVKVARPKPASDDVVLDKWGCMEGSKNSQALAMFEKGATAKEVKDEIGGTYYNIMKKMVENGHTLEKDGAIIKIIHKDEKGKKSPAKAAAKKGKK